MAIAATKPPPQLLRGLYVITDPNLTPGPVLLLDRVAAALRGGARVVQYRAKHVSPAQRLQDARALRQLTQQYDALLIINDDPSLCVASAADGVHVGREDASVMRAREEIGPDRILGVTCHGHPQLATAAQAAGADYVAFGRFYPSHTKPEAEPAALAKVAPFITSSTTPCVAIGGITVNNAPNLIAAGFAMVAVIHDVFASADIEARCRAYTRLFAPTLTSQDLP